MKKIICFLVVSISLTFTACKKYRDECKSGNISVKPFVEKYGVYNCGGNDYEYTYVFRKKNKIDSLVACSLNSPIAFPSDETDMLYIMFAKLSYHHRDTLMTNILKDSCLKVLTYEVNMVQRDTTVLCCPYGISVVRSMFCSVSSIPADYKVNVNYKYVPLK